MLVVYRVIALVGLFLVALLRVSKNDSVGSGDKTQRRRLYSMQVLPRLSDSDMVELYHLRSFPTQLIQSSVGSFLVQTSGIALRSTATQKLVVLEYRPANYSACFLPVVHLRENNKSTLHWDKRSVLSYKTELDKKYWQQSTFLGRINGVVYENYVQWMEDYISRDKIFVPQSICSSANEISCFVKAETWETFLTDSLEMLASLAVQMNAIIPPRAKEMHLLSNTEPVRFRLARPENAPPIPDDDAGSLPSSGVSQQGGGVNGGGDGGSEGQVEDPYTPPGGDQSYRAVPVGGSGGATEGVSDGSQPGAGGEALVGVEPSDGQSPPRPAPDNPPRGKGRGRGRGRGRRLVGSSSPYSSPSSSSPSAAAAANANATASASASAFSATSSSSPSPAPSSSSSSSNSPSPSPASNSTVVTGSDRAAEVASMTNVTEAEMAAYYSSLMLCMQEYTMEDFTSALGSCLTDRIGYIHIQGQEYYRIAPRFPFALLQEYLQPIPLAAVATAEPPGASDWAIFMLLLAAAFAGLVASLWKLNLLDWLILSSNRGPVRRKRIGASAPAEGGYSKASELPVYQTKGGVAPSSASSGLIGALGSLASPLSLLSPSSSSSSSSSYGPGASYSLLPSSSSSAPHVFSSRSAVAFFNPSPFAPASFLPRSRHSSPSRAKAKGKKGTGKVIKPKKGRGSPSSPSGGGGRQDRAKRSPETAREGDDEDEEDEDEEEEEEEEAEAEEEEEEEDGQWDAESPFSSVLNFGGGTGASALTPARGRGRGRGRVQGEEQEDEEGEEEGSRLGIDASRFGSPSLSPSPSSSSVPASASSSAYY